MKMDTLTESEPPLSSKPSRAVGVLPVVAWVVAISLVVCALYIGWRVFTEQPILITKINSSPPTMGSYQVSTSGVQDTSPQIVTTGSVGLPGLMQPVEKSFIPRRSSLHTDFPNRPRQDIRTYTVRQGDSVFEIADKFNIQPETVLSGQLRAVER